MKNKKISGDAFFWALQGISALHRKPFSNELARQQLAAPYTIESLGKAAQAYGFEASLRKAKCANLHKETFPLVAWLSAKPASAAADASAENTPTDLSDITPVLLLRVDTAHVLVTEADGAAPRTISLSEFNQRYSGHITRITPQADSANDADSEAQARQARKFGFSWFIPELLKHKRLWQEVLLASLVIQLIALATPLFTQAIIDKVIAHRSESTLIVIAIGMLVFMLFSAGCPGCASTWCCTQATGLMPYWALRCSSVCSNCRRCTFSTAPPA